MYKLAIFDFDGTLVDSAPGIVTVMEQVALEYNLPTQIVDDWKNLIGVPLVKQMQTVLPDKNEEYWTQVAERYRAIYDQQTIEICPPFPFLKDMLAKLTKNDIKISIASSKRRHLIEEVLAYHNLLDYFCLVIGAQDVNNHKPHPESVQITLSNLNINYQEAVVIGDSTYDLEMARNANVDSIGVTTGIHTRQILHTAGPRFVADNLNEVLDLILNGRKI